MKFPQASEAAPAVVSSGVSAFGSTVKFENAGRQWHASYEKVAEVPEDIEDDDDSLETGAEVTPRDKKANDPKKIVRSGMLKLDDNLKDVDLYALLNVHEDANSKELKDAYRQMCLVYHPDKAKDEKSAEEINEKYIQITTAYEILDDTIKRRKFDSARYFDDTVPKESEITSDDLFYRKFGPVFQRNARWSMKQPVPEFPDASVTDIKVVQDFYAFWFHLDSWRDFDVKITEEEGDSALEDPEKADSREERRHIEKENARIRQKYRNKESKRIMQLAETGEKCDPRIKAFKEEQFRKKNAGKMKKEAERLAAEEAVKQEAEEALKKEKEDAEKKLVEKAAKEGEKAVIKNLRRDVRGLTKELWSVSTEQMQDLLVVLKKDQLSTLLEALNGKDTKAATEIIFSTMKDNNINPVVLDAEVAKANAKKQEMEAELRKQEEEAAAQAEDDNKKGKKNKKKNKKGGDRMEEVIAEAEEKVDKSFAQKQHADDTKKKQDQAKKKAQQKQQEQKNATKQAEKEAAAAAKAQKEKEEVDKKKAEEQKKLEDMKAKQRESAVVASKAAEEERLSVIYSEQYVVVREERLAQYQKVEDVASALEAEITTELKTAIATSEGDEDDRLDIAAVLVANFTSLRFFEIAKANNPVAVNVPNALRGKLKKARATLRAALKKYLSGKVGAVQKEFEKVLAGDFPEEEWQVVKKGDASGKSKKKKGGAKKEKDEDLDELFSEFNIEEAPSKKKSKKKN